MIIKVEYRAHPEVSNIYCDVIDVKTCWIEEIGKVGIQLTLHDGTATFPVDEWSFYKYDWVEISGEEEA